MTANEMIRNENLIEVDGNYLTDDGVVLIRCYGRGTSAYWVRNDEALTAYRSVVDAYYGTNRHDIRRMKRSTALAILSSVKYYLENGGELKEA